MSQQIQLPPQAGGVQPSVIFVPYVYVAKTSATIAANGQGNVSLILDQDADFELHYMIASSSIDLSSDYRANNFSVQLQDKSNARLWSSDFIPQAHINTNDGAARLVRPVVLAKRSNLYFTFTNLTATPLIPTVTLWGAKISKG